MSTSWHLTASLWYNGSEEAPVLQCSVKEELEVVVVVVGGILDFHVQDCKILMWTRWHEWTLVMFYGCFNRVYSPSWPLKPVAFWTSSCLAPPGPHKGKHVLPSGSLDFGPSSEVTDLHPAWKWLYEVPTSCRWFNPNHSYVMRPLYLMAR